MHFGLSEEQEMIVSTVRSFVENEIYPHEAEVERTGQVPHELGEKIKHKCIDLAFTPVTSLKRSAVRACRILISLWLSENWAEGPWR